jgi:hypothetical protein
MLREWPICPRPEHDESLPSWIERIGREYGMSAAALVNSIDAPSGPRARWPAPPTLQRLYESRFVDRLVLLSRLSPLTCTALWPPMTGWELREFTFRAYCPLCCLKDIRAGRTPYGRQCWQQSWWTVCALHRYPLVADKPRAPSGYETTWSAAELRQDMQFLAANRYRDLKVASESEIRRVMLGSLLEIERALADALAGITPNRLVWGNLTAQKFLTVVDDVTTWSLTHFEPVSAWSGAEDLTAVEEQEGYGIVGRLRRQCGSQEHQSPHGQRTLREVTHPKVRGAALWVAHALLTSCHGDASDRSSGSTPLERQIARILRSAPASREWLAHRQERWPTAYRRQWWIDVRRIPSTSIAAHNAWCDMNC